MTDKVPFFWALNRSRVCCTILMIQQFFAPIKSKCSATFDVIFIDTFLNKWTSFILKLHRVNPREIPENKESEEFRMGWLLWNIIQRLIVIITSGGLISIDLCRKIASLCSTSFGHTSTWNNLQSSELHGDQVPSEIVRTRRNFVSLEQFWLSLNVTDDSECSSVCNPPPSTTPSIRKRHDQKTFSVECCHGLTFNIFFLNWSASDNLAKFVHVVHPSISAPFEGEIENFPRNLVATGDQKLIV